MINVTVDNIIFTIIVLIQTLVIAKLLSYVNDKFDKIKEKIQNLRIEIEGKVNLAAKTGMLKHMSKDDLVQHCRDVQLEYRKLNKKHDKLLKEVGKK